MANYNNEKYRRLLGRSLRRGDLKGRSVRAGLATVLGQGCNVGLKLIGTVILARLLTPEDYGVVGMTMVVTTFVGMFADMGLSTVTVQREEISHEQVSTLFWLNLGICMFVGGVIAALGPLAAMFYREPRVADLMLAYAGLPLVVGLSLQHEALLRRQMRFGTIACVRVVSMVAGVSVGIGMAYMGAGPWSLVGIEIAAAGVCAVAFPVVVGWWPSRPMRGVGIREMLGFGGTLTLSNVVNHWARKGDDMIIGRLWGTHELGLYSRAYSLLCLPLQQIVYPLTGVAIPALSSLSKDPIAFRAYYLRMVRLIASVCFPIVVFMAVMAEGVTLLLLGEQWMGAAGIFRVLALAGAMQAVTAPVGCIYISLGRTKRMMKWTLMSTPVILGAFVVGVQWKAIGVAYAYTGTMAVVILPACIAYAFHGSPLRVAGFVRALFRPVVIAGGMGLVLLWLRLAVRGFGMDAASTCVSIPVALGAWLILNRCFSENGSCFGEAGCVLGYLRNRA